jgi:hypothetical protein
MAVTAHWIQATTANGSHKLILRSDLIGFHKIPGRHNGRHLANCFLYIIDRLKITDKVCFYSFYLFLAQLLIHFKIGWITCDNASNNDTLMETLETLLAHRHIEFDQVKSRIRYAYITSLFEYGIYETVIRCFPHIVNLACKAVLGMLTTLEYINETQEDYDPTSAFGRDCIATIRSLISTVCSEASADLLYANIIVDSQ